MPPKNSGIILQIKLELTVAFFMVNMGPMSFYRGLKIQYDSNNQIIKLLQLAYIDKVFTRFHFNKAYAVTTLIKQNTTF